MMEGPTKYGFDWGPAKVERLAHIEGRGRVLEVRTEHARVQVHVTEAGRKINVYRVSGDGEFHDR